MARRDQDIIRLSVRGAGRTAASLNRAQRQIQDDIVATLRELGADAEFLAQQAAPEDTSDLLEAVRAITSFRVRRPTVRIIVDRLSGHQGEERDRFDYLDVTRFGHRKREIHPVRRRALKVHYAGHRSAAIFDFASFVPGAIPDRDWVEEAQDFITPAIDRAENRLARRVERSIR